MLDAVAEFNPFDDFRQAARTVEFAPFLLGGQHQLVGHRQRRLAAEAALGPGGSVADGGKEPAPDAIRGAFDRVRCANVLSVFGREIADRQQVGAVSGQAFHRPVVLHAVSFDEEIERGIGLGFGFGHLLPGRACLHA